MGGRTFNLILVFHWGGGGGVVDMGGLDGLRFSWDRVIWGMSSLVGGGSTSKTGKKLLSTFLFYVCPPSPFPSFISSVPHFMFFATSLMLLKPSRL